ncbi:EamA family transporter [Paenibacillus sp. NPDC058174]|uniref:EamA family transporter n=1 Tax=Paenibacillus sp. NPDC058174 TaxID=3346366 RepID=UPI0036DCD0C1
MSTTYAILLVLSSAIAHSVWNLFMKKSVHKESFLWLIQTIAAVIFMPAFLHDLFTMDWTFQRTGLLLTSFVFQSVYLLLLAKAYKAGDMSQVYPMMRGSAALLIPLLGLVIYEEELTHSGWLGLGLIVVGLFALSGIFKNRLTKQSIITILLTGTIGISITGYTLADKSILLFMSPLGLLQIYNLAGVIALGAPALRSKKVRQEWMLNRRLILIGSIMAPGSYLLFLMAMQFAPISHISPIREISIVFGTILAWTVLKEKQGAGRIGYSAIILLGIILIGFF